MTAGTPGQPNPATILLVEDDNDLRDLLHDELADAGHTVTAVASAEAARERLDPVPELVITDLRLPGEDGLALLGRLQGLGESPGVILITAFGTVPQAVEALKQGADDFLTKPLDLDHFRLAVGRALETRRLRREVARYRRVLDEENGFHGILGRSAPMQRLFEQIRAVARADGPVLIIGESGTGKELVAHAVHAESPRAERPFVAVNCAGIPADLMESELFGHTAGAFTGAQRARRGLFAEAEGGTLFLDEIGEMPLEMQSKLLRVLQDGALRPVGANREQHVDVRIVAATNRDLEEQVARGDFREDLYYRLETFALTIAPLRQRDDDIERLAARFLERFAAAQGKAIQGLESDALARLKAYPFPGNVRELANAMERAVTFCNGETIRADHLPERMGNTRPEAATGGDDPWSDDPAALPTLAEVERRYIDHVLKVTNGNKRRAATILDIGRRTLYRRLEGEEPRADPAGGGVTQ
mgnify:CR=1 FL=1